MIGKYEFYKADIVFLHKRLYNISINKNLLIAALLVT